MLLKSKKNGPEEQLQLPKAKALPPVSQLGKLGTLCEQLIEQLDDSRQEALQRAESHAAACEANIDYLRNLAKAHHETEADLIRRFEKAASDVERLRTEFMEPYTHPMARIDEAALTKAITSATHTEEPHE